MHVPTRCVGADEGAYTRCAVPTSAAAAPGRISVAALRSRCPARKILPASRLRSAGLLLLRVHEVGDGMSRMLLLLLVACQDYTLDDDKGGDVGFDTGSGPPVMDTADTSDTSHAGDTADTADTSACTLDVPAAGGASEVVTCGAAAVSDPWNVVLRDRWLGTEAGYLYMSEQVATGNLNDDNGDGRIDGDDISDIVLMMAYDVCASEDTHLLALSGADLTPLWEVAWPWLDMHTGPAVGDVDGDGSPDIVVQTDMTSTVMFDAHGVEQWSSDPLMQYNLPGPGLADLDGDGHVEVLASKAVIDGATGAVERILSDDFGGAAVASDLNLDGVAETLYEGYVYDTSGAVVGDSPYRGEYEAIWDQDGDPTTAEVVWTSGTVIFAGTSDWRTAWSWTGSGLMGPPT